MSDLLTHWAVFEDCRRLAQGDPAVEPLFRELIQTERDFARLGAITRGGNRWIPTILQWARACWDDPARPASAGRKVAFALGGLTHAACDRLMKPLLSYCARTDWNSAHHRMQGRLTDTPAGSEEATIQEISAYYDTYVFRQVYLSGEAEPFNRFLLAANETAPGKALEEFVRALFQRALLSCHTIVPDQEHVLEWLDRLTTLVQPFYLDVDLWVRVFLAPDPAKMERYLVETVFYRVTDRAIQVARALQRGEAVSTAQVQRALEPGANESRYGQALETGIRYLRAASAFWRRELDEPALKDALDFGKPDVQTHPLRIPVG
jgi:hypothetical protein